METTPAQYLGLAPFLLATAYTDLRWEKIHNRVTYPGIVIGLVLNAVLGALGESGIAWGGWEGVQHGLSGFFVCGLVILVCFVVFPIGGVGGGDVKLIAMMGAFLGVDHGIEAMLWTFVLGAVLAVAMLIWRMGVGTILRNRSDTRGWCCGRVRGSSRPTRNVSRCSRPISTSRSRPSWRSGSFCGDAVTRNTDGGISGPERRGSVNRQVLESLLPAGFVLMAAFIALAVLLRFVPAQWRPSRLRLLHGCEQGGVQSLAFVLTLPIFLTLVTFIVQVSQILVGMTVANYAAFAGARAASVWVPARVGSAEENELDLPFTAAEESTGLYHTVAVAPELDSVKLQKIRMAAVMACAGISPSRDLGLTPLTAEAGAATTTTLGLYPAMVPSSLANGRTDDRIRNKIAYADHHTLVVLEWLDTSRNTVDGPSYNPRDYPDPENAHLQSGRGRLAGCDDRARDSSLCVVHGGRSNSGEPAVGLAAIAGARATVHSADVDHESAERGAVR